ncbi:MAG: hypothetical protein OEW87_10785 [Flavobacteriaceae bacterium]|nr:hypothetical protein [Flavobacteriaceae bacterium]
MNHEAENQKIDLNSFAEMAGFPVELVAKELFDGKTPTDGISLEQLREAMLGYLDSTMLED